MMRQVQRGKKGKKPRKKTEPLAEGIISLDRSGRRKWSSVSDEEIIRWAVRFISEMGICNRAGLSKADGSLYVVLRRRNLMERIGLKKRRDWASMSDDELVGYAKKFINREEITGRKELRERDSGLYNVLIKRKLLEEIGLENRNDGYSDWSSISQEELLSFTKKFMEDNGITRRWELEKANRKLYKVLVRRGLLNQIGFEEKLRDWSSMSDGELLEFAQKVLEKKGISGRRELKKVDGGLYEVLRRRGLLGSVFSLNESEQQKEAVQEVVDAMSEFGD